MIILLLSTVFASASAQEGRGSNRLPPGISQRHQESVLKYLRPALMGSGGAGRIYYSMVCASEAEDGPLAFPEVKAGPPSKEKLGVTAVREIFKNDKQVKVSQDRSGMIRVMIGQPASSLLQTKIPSLSFKPDEQYNGELAIWAIFNAKEVEAAMRRLRLELPETIFSGSTTEPEEGRIFPHLPPSLKNVTIDQALDEVARAFGGIVIYESCTDAAGKRFVSIDFVAVAALLR
jgi:hypothetical protein